MINYQNKINYLLGRNRIHKKAQVANKSKIAIGNAKRPKLRNPRLY